MRQPELRQFEVHHVCEEELSSMSTTTSFHSHGEPAEDHLDNCDAEFEEHWQVFYSLIEDGSASVTTASLGRKLEPFLEILGESKPTPDELTDVVNDLDTDGSGTFSFSNYLTFASRRPVDREEEEAEKKEEEQAPEPTPDRR